MVNGIVYIYYFYQYDRPVVLNVKYELSNPREPGPLSMLFPEDVREEAARRYKDARSNLVFNKAVGISWPVIVFVSLILLFAVCAEFKKGLILVTCCDHSWPGCINHKIYRQQEMQDWFV